MLNFDHDLALSALAHLSPGTSVTVTTGGTVVSGVITRRAQWLDYVRDRMNQYHLERFREAWTQTDADLTTAYVEDPDGMHLAIEPFLHLTEARILAGTPGTPPSGNGIAWRIDLTRIDGWAAV